MGKIIAIVNQKGSVGKTTTTTYLAKALTNKNKKVLIIDLDPLSDSISRFDMSAEEITTPLSECMDGKATLKDCIVSVGNSEMSIAYGGKHLIGFEITAMNHKDREEVLAKSLTSVKEDYDYILIDTPSSLGLLTMNALTAANDVIIPIRCDYSIFEGMAELLRTINDVSNELNPNLTIAGFLVTHVNPELRSTSVNLKEIHTCYGDKVFHTLIPSNEDLSANYSQFAAEIFV